VPQAAPVRGPKDRPESVIEVRVEAEAITFPSVRFYDRRKIMQNNRKSRRGRPATGTDPMVDVRMSNQRTCWLRSRSGRTSKRMFPR
jgi:hypothetical protein